jgi:predicted short-subunit dehydrogenase-like oxidoreductase (DUF2520 family)
MKISIIGSGNVATHIAKALNLAGVEIAQIWSFHYENAQILAKLVNTKAVEEINDLNSGSDICLIAVKDDAIPAIVHQLKDYKGLLAHTSGAVDLGVFEGRTSDYGVFYPLQTFSKQKELDFSKVPLCLEAKNANALKQLNTLASLLSKNIYEIDSEKRKILHLSAVFACNFTNHLYVLAQQILAHYQIDFDIIRPLIEETAHKVQTALPSKVQTGPAIRNDQQTLAKHEMLLQEMPQLLEIYRILSESIKKNR